MLRLRAPCPRAPAHTPHNIGARTATCCCKAGKIHPWPATRVLGVLNLLDVARSMMSEHFFSVASTQGSNTTNTRCKTPKPNQTRRTTQHRQRR